MRLFPFFCVVAAFQSHVVTCPGARESKLPKEWCTANHLDKAGCVEMFNISSSLHRESARKLTGPVTMEWVSNSHNSQSTCGNSKGWGKPRIWST